ncbi:hypothetical protein [Neisseria iguanae]|nr:hypothetical protein [Neisseria iguanae]
MAKYKISEQCGLGWRSRSQKPLKETFGEEGVACLERHGLKRNSLSEDTRITW